MNRFCSLLSASCALALVGMTSAVAQVPPGLTPLADRSQARSMANKPIATNPIVLVPTPAVNDLLNEPGHSTDDITPDHWAYKALQRLSEIGCLEGNDPGGFQNNFYGNQAISRMAFAATLNTCLNAVLNTSYDTPDQRSRNGIDSDDRPPSIESDESEELGELRAFAIALEREFLPELTQFQSQTEALVTRLDRLQAQQFSTTTVMGGEAILGVVAGTGGEPPGQGDAQTTLSYLSRLGLVTSFTGRDRLRAEFLAGNFADRGLANPNAFNTDMTLLSFQGDTNNELQLSKLEYRFAVGGDRLVITLRPVGFSLSSVLTANSPYFDAGRGALSRFAEANPIFKIGALEAGLGVDWLVTDNLRLQLAYGAGDTSDAQTGFFNSRSSAIGAQLLLKPSPTLLTGLSYVNAYSNDGRLNTFTGSFRADTASFLDAPATIQAIGATLQWRFAADLTLGAWGSVIWTDAIDSNDYATVTTYLASLGYSDPFGRQGDLLALLIGQPPKLVNGHGLTFGDDPGTTLHTELFYRFLVNDRLSITPGLIWIHHPEHDANNQDILIGVVRTTFRF